MNASLPKAIIFDLDDTLITQTETSETSWREIFDLYAAHFEASNRQKTLEAILKSVRWFWSDPTRHKRGRLDLRKARREIVAGVFLAQKIDNPFLVVMLADSLSARREGAVALFPDVITTLTCLRGLGLKLGLVTNGESKGQRDKIDRFGLAALFDLIQIEEEAGIGKPEAGVYEMVLQKLAIVPEEAWMIGDNLIWDIEAAQKAGLKAVWIDRAGKGLPADTGIQPDRIIRSLAELLPL
jgi:putative hydrolase of the HAD superfamily